MSDEFPMRVELQGRGKPRQPGEVGAFDFQQWLGECRQRGYTVRLAEDESHAVATPAADPVHTIPHDVPPEACQWPACADPICERNENGTCPLSNAPAIVECAACGAARGIGMACASCGYGGTLVGPSELVKLAREEPSDGDEEFTIKTGDVIQLVPIGPDGDGEAAHAVTAAPPPARGPNTIRRRKVVFVDDDATVISQTALRALLAVAGDMRTLAEALGVSPSTISRALSSDLELPERDDRIRAVHSLLEGKP